jgi:hypothetical protein
MHDTMNKIHRLKNCSTILLRGGLSAEEQQFLLESLAKDTEGIQKVLDAYYVSERSNRTMKKVA